MIRQQTPIDPDSWAQRGIEGVPIERADALALLDPERTPLLPLVHAAGVVRRARFGNRVRVHVLNNVQNGACPEDCGYCGQAKTSDAPIKAYTLKSREEIIDEAAQAKASGAFRYCMVLSGRGPDDDDIEHMAHCIREVKERFGIETCLSSGLLDEQKAQRLKDAGLDRLNHNLNTSRERYPDICTTHTYQDRLDTLRAARSAGLQLCSGLIVGMGESQHDLVDLAFELESLRTESIPVNFLVPIMGNRIGESPTSCGKPLSPELCVRVLCLFRLANPRAEVRVAAGREGHLRSLQTLAMEPANSLFVDGYLLTHGAGPIPTLRMLRDGGFEIELAGAGWDAWNERLRSVLDSGELDVFHVDSIRPAETGVLKEDRLSERKLAKLRIEREPI
ncbi:MAG: biotin synthase BioB [Planctomycetota bacterium]